MIDLTLDDRIYIDNDLDAALQELDLLFNTECTELIGDKSFGVALDQFLWTITPTTESLKRYISEKLSECKCLQLFNYNFDVEYLDDEEFRSVYHLTINIYLDNNEKIKKEYDFK